MEQQKKEHKQNQIRVFVDRIQLDSIKSKAKQLGMSVEHYSGLVLSGYQITKKELV
jgi:hypothetical protein